MPKLSEVTGNKLKLSQLPQTVTPTAPSPEELARKEYDSMPWWRRAVVSAGGESQALLQGAGQLLGVTDQQTVDAQAPQQDAMHGSSNFIGRALPYLATAAIGGPEAGLAARGVQLGNLAKLALAAGEGAAYGGVRETRSGESRLLNAGLGAGAGGLGRLVVGAGHTAISRFGQDGVDRAAGKALKREANDAASMLEPQPSATPGYLRTLAQESRDPGIARLEQTMRGRPGYNWDALDTANNAAQRNVLEGIAGAEADMAAAIAARDAATGALRDQAMQEGAQAAAANQQARALMLGGESGLSSLRAQVSSIAQQNASRPTVQSALNDVSRALEKSGDSVQGLYGVRQYIGDLLSGKAGADKGYAKAASRELIAMRDMIDQEISSRAPSWQQYLTAFQDQSVPINRMEIGKALLEKSAQGARTDNVGLPMLSPAKLAKLPRDLDTVAQRATGFSKATADKSLTPSDMQALKALQDDAERAYLAATSGTGGNSATASRGGVIDRFTKAGIGMVPGGKYLNGLVSLIADRDAAKVESRIGQLLANPEEARRVLSQLDSAQAGKLYKLLAPRTAAMVQGVLADRPRAEPLRLDIVGGQPVAPAALDAQLSAQGF